MLFHVDVQKDAKGSLFLSAENNLSSLKRQSDFKHLKDQGQFVHITHWLAVNYKKNNQESLRWAWTVSKKVGNAVTRNRLKRWGREIVREFSEKEIDINFIFKQKKARNFYREITRPEFDAALTKAFEKTNSNLV